MVSRNTLNVNIDGDARDLERTLRGAGRELDDFARAGGNTSRLIGAGFSLMSVGITAAVGSMGLAAIAAKGLADDASDLIETQNKVNEVFAGSAEGIMAWSETSATAFGLSKREALDAAGTFGNLFVQLGLGTDEASGLSTQMVSLAADFASFHNADVTDVIIAQTAAFRGEYDALQRFVPTITAAAVEQRALELGLAKTSAELSAQDKALATQKLMVEGAGDALGDFARTADGAANQQRILTANLANMRAEIGTALLPVVNDIVTAINDWIATNGDEFIDDMTGAIEGTISAAQDLYDVLNDIRNSGPVEVLVSITMAGLGALGEALEAISQVPGAAADVYAGIAATIRGIGSGAARAGGAAMALPRALAGLQRDVAAGLGGGTASDGFLAQAGMLPESGRVAPRPDAIPGDADMGIGLEGAGAAFLAARRPRAGTGERVPTARAGGGGGAAARGPDSFSAASLGLIDQIMTGLPGDFAPGSLDAASVQHYEDEARRFQAIRSDVNRQLAELGLTMADLDARGGEDTETFAGLKDRMDALRDAAQRIDLVEDLRLTPWKDAIDLVSASIEANLEAQKKMADSLFELSTDFLNVKIGPGAQGAFSEFFGKGAGFGPGGEFYNVGGSVDVVVP